MLWHYTWVAPPSSSRGNFYPLRYRLGLTHSTSYVFSAGSACVRKKNGIWQPMCVFHCKGEKHCSENLKSGVCVFVWSDGCSQVVICDPLRHTGSPCPYVIHMCELTESPQVTCASPHCVGDINDIFLCRWYVYMDIWSVGSSEVVPCEGYGRLPSTEAERHKQRVVWKWKVTLWYN